MRSIEQCNPDVVIQQCAHDGGTSDAFALNQYAHALRAARRQVQINFQYPFCFAQPAHACLPNIGRRGARAAARPGRQATPRFILHNIRVVKYGADRLVAILRLVTA